jgi:hypothetical protein
MSWVGGQTGITAGSTYAIAQSASMGGAATGVVATIGGMSVGGLAMSVVVPVVVGGAAVYAAKQVSRSRSEGV